MTSVVQFAVCLFKDGEDVAVQGKVFVLVAVAVGFAVFFQAGKDVMREAFVCGQGRNARCFGCFFRLFFCECCGFGGGFCGVFRCLFGFGVLCGAQFFAQDGGVFEVGAVFFAPFL